MAIYIAREASKVSIRWRALVCCPRVLFWVWFVKLLFFFDWSLAAMEEGVRRDVGGAAASVREVALATCRNCVSGEPLDLFR